MNENDYIDPSLDEQLSAVYEDINTHAGKMATLIISFCIIICVVLFFFQPKAEMAYPDALLNNYRIYGNDSTWHIAKITWDSLGHGKWKVMDNHTDSSIMEWTDSLAMRHSEVIHYGYTGPDEK